jgi:GT2 family glycosyltransferase
VLHTIPSGVGFCFYIRRALLQEQPFLNEKLIQRGYGEETEFCLKAAAKGWKNVVATNVFVAHKGGVSFGEEKQALARHHVAQIHARFPRHSAEYERFLHQKPLQPLFQKVNERRMALL